MTKYHNIDKPIPSSQKFSRPLTLCLYIQRHRGDPTCLHSTIVGQNAWRGSFRSRVCMYPRVAIRRTRCPTTSEGGHCLHRGALAYPSSWKKVLVTIYPMTSLRMWPDQLSAEYGEDPLTRGLSFVKTVP